MQLVGAGLAAAEAKCRPCVHLQHNLVAAGLGLHIVRIATKALGEVSERPGPL